MKNFKRLMAAFLAVTMVFALSVTGFAAINNTNGYYTWAIGFEDLEGNPIETLTAGSEAYITVSFYTTEGNNNVEISAHNGASFAYGIFIDNGLMADAGDYNADTVSFNTTLGDTKIENWSEYGDEYQYLSLVNTLDVKSASLTNSKPIAKHKINVTNEVGTYFINFNEDAMMTHDGSLGSKSPVYNNTTVNVVAASMDVDYTAVSTLSDAAKEQITTNFPGKNYYVAGTPIVFEGSATAKYIYATDGTNTKKSPKSIQEYLNIGDGVGATIIPVIVTANATGPAITFSVAE